ncbi:MAG: tetrahydrofolate dehydrogenase/cyclohydrolase catalytic domain-containing protein, partial [Patescibacteria group bacterium]
MIIDGKKIAGELKAELKSQLNGRPLVLGAIVVGADPATAKFVALKQKVAADIGIDMRALEFPEDVAEQDLVELIERLTND